MSKRRGEATAGVPRQRAGLRAAGTLVLAAGLGLTSSALWMPLDVKAQTSPATPPDAGDLSLGIVDPNAPKVTVAPVPRGFTFRSVSVQGNVHVDAATIVSYLALSPGKPVTEAQLNDAYQRIFGSGLFQWVELVPQGSQLLIKVAENPVIGVVDFQGNARIADADLTKIVKSQSRRIYSPATAEADTAAITEAYRTAGRMAATITPRIIRRSNNTVDLVFEISEGGVAEVSRLSFVGNKAFSDYRLRQVLSTKQAGILHKLIQRDMYQTDRVELDKKLLSDFYLSHGFLDFQILDAGATYARDRSATFLTFTIQEGQSFRIGKVATISEVQGIDPAEFDRLRQLRPGVTYNPAVIQNNVDAMDSLALKKGLNFVMIEPRFVRHDRDGTVDVTFAIVKGQRAFVERIDIEGNTTTLDSVIRRQFHTVEGDPMNPTEIAQAAERIRALGFFSDVAVTQEPGSSPDQDVVKVAVTEAPTGSLTLGATYGLSSGLGLAVGFSETNFLGRGQALDVNVQTGSSNVNSRIAFTEPAFLGRDLAFSFEAIYGKTTHQNSNYDTRTISVSPSLTFPVGDLSKLKLNYRVARDEVLNVDAGSSIIIASEKGGKLESSAGYTYTWDNRLSGLHPKGGVLVQFGQNFAGLGGDVKYISTSARAVAETTVLSGDVTVRATLEGGMINSVGNYTTRVTDRFFTAGSMRGFEPNGLGPRDLGAANRDALGGNMYAAAHLESEFPLGLPEEYGIKGGAFVDVGSIWGLDNTAGSGGAVDDSLRLRSVVGLSVFWKTPLGPLRFDFSHALKKETYDKEQSFDFSISTKF
jgi:outer membrane protein insertion porin family